MEHAEELEESHRETERLHDYVWPTVPNNGLCLLGFQVSYHAVAGDLDTQDLTNPVELCMYLLNCVCT